MAEVDYVTSANTITDASALDYLKCFQDALDSKLDGSSDVQRELEIVKGGSARLTFAMTIRVLRSTRVATFTLDLDPVSVKRIDVLESKLRDQQDELERLREQFDGGRELPSIQLTASSKNSSSNLIWNKPESDDFTVIEDGAVTIHRPGLYSIAAAVDCTPTNYNQSVSLVKNGVSMQSVYCSYVGSCCHCSATLSTSSRMEQDDELTIHCVSKVGCGTYLSIAQLGR